MADRERHRQLYRTWLVGPDANDTRRDAAYELRTALANRTFSDQTFEDLIVILNHEFLCIKLGHDANNSLVARCSIDLEPSLDNPFLDALLEDLCKPLIRSLSDSDYPTYELQFRTLLSTFTVLYSRRVDSFSNEFHQNLQRLLQERFRDLRWHPDGSGDLTYKKHLKVQCSYLLSAAAEYFSRFRRAEPIAVTLASRAIGLLSFGVAVAAPAMGMGTGNLQPALTELNNCLRAVSNQPQERYSGLFILQEFTRLAQALALLTEIAENTPRLRQFAWIFDDRLNYCITTTLENVMSTISLFDDYENRATPPASFWNNIQAATARGPPTFNEFYYLYGTVDCAVQVSRVGTPDIFLDELGVKMIAVALSDCEPSHRWKALEYSLSSAGNVEVAAGYLLHECRQDRRERLCGEINCLAPDTPTDLVSYGLQSQSSRSGVSNDSTRPSIVSELSSSHWKEPCFSLPQTKASCTRHTISPKTSRKTRFLGVGLSPDCNAMFTLDDNEACVYSLSSSQTSRDSLRLLKQKSTQKLTQAALSNKYIATISRDDLLVTSYDQNRDSDNAQAKVAFRCNGDAYQFYPRCLSIYDGCGTTWIAVAGQYSSPARPNAGSGSIRVYKVSRTGTGIIVAKTGASFNGSTSDPLETTLIKHVSFCPSGERLVAVTRANTVLIWPLWNDMRPKHEPFCIYRKYPKNETGAQGITSGTLFQGPSTRSYVLCTTWPSSERHLYGGEWSYISPVADHPHRPPDEIVHDITKLGKIGPILTGAASPDGRYIAVLEKTGEVTVLPLEARSRGGYRCLDGVKLEPRQLKTQEKAGASSMRFRYSSSELELFAVDDFGHVLHKRFDDTRELAQTHSHRTSLASLKSNG